LSLDLNLIGAFVLALARTSAWVMAAPVFGSRGVSSVGRLGLAIALSMFVAPLAAPAVEIPTDVIPFALMMVGQVIVGLVLGWATGLILHAFEMAGSAIDLASGVSIGAIIDPISGNQGALFSRFTNLLFVTLLFATDAYQSLVAGFVRSFAAVPPDVFPALDGAVAMRAAAAVGGLMVAALEIGAPVLGALFLTEVALAMAARFAPQANVFMLGMPLKLGVAFVALGLALVYLPTHLGRLVETSMRTGAGFLG
jgi:flagellar biosynthesis protein FliR